MVHFLRKNYKPIIECEVYDDLSISVYVKEYSKTLLDLYKEDLHDSFIESISYLNELRGAWWEKDKNSGNYLSADDFVKEKFLEVANKYNLNYIID